MRVIIMAVYDISMSPHWTLLQRVQRMLQLKSSIHSSSPTLILKSCQPSRFLPCVFLFPTFFMASLSLSLSLSVQGPFNICTRSLLVVSRSLGASHVLIMYLSNHKTRLSLVFPIKFQDLSLEFFFLNQIIYGKQIFNPMNSQ